MIPEHSIESGDFSAELPRIQNKLDFLADALRTGFEIEPNTAAGLGAILSDLAHDIGVINTAMCEGDHERADNPE